MIAIDALIFRPPPVPPGWTGIGAVAPGYP
jgi:hypothetical protein